ncbi:MAG: bifunctional 4-hydroxy-2-oxoglutarate aldolase/2-dehydro-3-deoxy-phosphogluconate aldolase [Candidatus Marinimicrobia bacterium]|nr:bifunctional 4-hydroxy-2-oxoglutarate aldolase/2-dehydro-3-deoxy-phosphogluconate aldolase [Candidatus Neomarinimicrobiota bacterium]|tara:strand:- start:8568 stop:9221 length:654 start_codon:yes stop_codon:yes gene_type:complete
MSFIEKISQHRLIPLFYHNDVEVCKKVLDAIINSNLPILEFANRGPKSIENFEHLNNHIGTNSNFLLGAGSVKNSKEAETFIKVGAKFIVSPFLDKSIGIICAKHNVSWIPGCGTLTEMIIAENSGAELIKLFPASVFGPKFISAVLAPCPNLKIMPTGGVTTKIDNLIEWFQSGAYCLGMGSKLISKKYLINHDFKGLQKHILQVIKKIELAKDKL